MALAIFFFSSKFISFKIKKVNKMQKELIKWYQQNKRDFPWRKDAPSQGKTPPPEYLWMSARLHFSRHRSGSPRLLSKS